MKSKITEEFNILNREEFISNFLIQAPIGILTFNKDWKIDFINQNFFKYLSLYKIEKESVLDQNILELDLVASFDFKDDLLNLPGKLSFEREIKSVNTLDRKHLSVILKGFPIFHNEIFYGGILIVEDIKYYIGEKPDLRQEHIENAINNICDFVFICDDKGKIKYSFGKKLNYLSEEEKTYQDHYVNLLLNNDVVFNKAFEKAVLERKPYKVNIELNQKDGSLLYECSIEPQFNWRKQIKFIFIFLFDISEIRDNNNLLTKEVSELKQVETITDSISDALFAINPKGEILFWNKSSEKLFGYSRNEVYGKFLGDILNVFDENYFKELKEEISKSDYWKVNLTIYKKNGQKEIVEAKFSFSHDENNLIVVLCSNVTERAILEQQLRTSEEKYRTIVETTSGLICSMDNNGNITFANKNLYELLGFSQTEILTKNIKDLIDQNYILNNNFAIKEYPSPIELPFITASGSKIILSSNFSLVYQNNFIKSVNASFNLISDEKYPSNITQVFNPAFHSLPEGLITVNDNKIFLFNKAFLEIFGYSDEDDVQNNNILNFIAETDVNRIERYLNLIKDKKDYPPHFDFLGKRKDDSIFYSEVTIGSFDYNGKNNLVMMFRDVTERKRSQQIIKESEEKYRNIAENIDDFLFTYERINKIVRPTFYTSSVEKITGYTQTDLLSDSRLFIKIIYPDDFNSIKSKIKNFMVSKIQLTGEFEFRIINKHGNIVWVRTKLNVQRDSSGRIQKIYGLVSDVTLRKNAENELNKSTENLVKLNETKDRFISIISHDLRTPFSSILGFTDLLLSDNELNSNERRQYVEFIQESSKSMLSLVNSLLDWTRLQTGRIRFEPERVEAQKIIMRSINALSGVAFQKRIKLTSNVESEIFIFVDQDLIFQAFNNLISNAIKFTRENGEIEISCAPTSRARFMEFSVKDNGIGIKKENLKKLFTVDTKFTSEGTAGEKGTGLGLSLVKEIIEKHGGTILVESEEGQGSNFKFTLPIGSANILLVDDSKTDRLLYSKILKNISPDYNIEVASNGEEALNIIIRQSPALVITDHLMPIVNGYDFVINLKKSNIKGKPPVIILSSNIDRHTIQDYTDLGIEYVFQKPVNLSNFKQAVEKSLKKGLLS